MQNVTEEHSTEIIQRNGESGLIAADLSLTHPHIPEEAALSGKECDL